MSVSSLSAVAGKWTRVSIGKSSGVGNVYLSSTIPLMKAKLAGSKRLVAWDPIAARPQRHTPSCGITHNPEQVGTSATRRPAPPVIGSLGNYSKSPISRATSRLCRARQSHLWSNSRPGSGQPGLGIACTSHPGKSQDLPVSGAIENLDGATEVCCRVKKSSCKSQTAQKKVLDATCS